MRLLSFIVLYFFCTNIYAVTLEDVSISQDKFKQALWFNKGVQELKSKHYIKAIEVFEQTKSYMFLPSVLNIAVSYKSLNQLEESQKRFILLLADDIAKKDMYIFLSANMNMYDITLNRKYLKSIVKYEKIIKSTSIAEYKLLSKAKKLLGYPEIWYKNGLKELEANNFSTALYWFGKSKIKIKYLSLLQIAIVNKKSNKIELSKKQFKKLINNNVFNNNQYVYLMANNYMYKLTHNLDYIYNIIKKRKNIFNTTNQQREILADAYIIIGNTQKAEFILSKNDDEKYFKKALLSLVNENYFNAKTNFELLLKDIKDERMKLDILWFLLYIDLKNGDITSAKNKINKIKNNDLDYNPDNTYKILLSLNTKRFDVETNIQNIKYLSSDMEIDLVFYFTPYLLDDEAQRKYTKSDNVFLLMSDYNKLLLDNNQKDPYILRDKLSKFKFKITKSYVHFNIGLSYAKLGEYSDAIDEFLIASNLSPSNNLYKVFTLLCAKKLNKTIKETQEFQASINVGSKSLISRQAKILNRLLLDNRKVHPSQIYGIDTDKLGQYIVYLASNKKDKSKLTFFNDINDPIKRLLFLGSKYSKDDFSYISNIQDNFGIPANLDRYPFIVAKLYIKYALALGLKNRLKSDTIKNNTPTTNIIKYAFNLYTNTLDIKIINNFLDIVIDYNIYSKDILYLSAAASLQENNSNIEDAYLGISLIHTLYKDKDSSFLIGIRYLKSKDYDKAIKNFNYKLSHEYLDIRLDGILSLLKEL